MDAERIVVIGASSGGVEAVSTVVRDLPEESDAAILVALHFPPGGTSLLPQILARTGSLEAAHARDGERLVARRIYIAPPDHHLIVRPGLLRLTRGPKENGFRPAIDVMFRSAARSYGNRVIGVVLSGNLDDGTAGLRAIASCGGITVSQDPADALYPGMPTSAVRNVSPDHVVPLDQVARLLDELLRQPLPSEMEVPERVHSEARAAEMEEQDPRSAPGIGVPSGLTCPECRGGLWEIDDQPSPRFRCRVGHAYTAETLLSEQGAGLEAALWSAVAALQERADLARRLESRMADRGLVQAAERFHAQADEAESRARVVLGVLDQDRLEAEMTLGDGPAFGATDRFGARPTSD